MNRRVVRSQVYRYDASGKLAAIYYRHGYIGAVVLELSPDMSSIAKVRNPRFIRREAISPTQYQMEIVEELVGREGNTSSFSHRIVRTLTDKDTDVQRWMNTASLDDLPVSPEDEITPEEEIWTGKREGNIGGGVALCIATLVAGWLAFESYSSDKDGLWFYLGALLILAYFLSRYPWKVPRRPDSAKTAQLRAHKVQMRQRSEYERMKARTEVEELLQEFGNWSRLTPRDFEVALVLWLKRQGYNSRTTQYSKDGGIDLEGIDPDGSPVIIQAKRYKDKVGVAVVREMMGVRQTRSDNPRAIIYSLRGYTREATRLALEHGIELRDIRADLLKL
jgi:hypothetical protein